VFLIVGLGAYQRLSASAEVKIRGSSAVAADERAEISKKRS
jgi:hypothetical protein